MLLLLAVDFIDELCSGAPTIGGPQIRSEFGLAYSNLSLLLLSVPLAVCLFVEAPLLLWAAKRAGRHGVAYAMVAQALAFLVAALARGPWSLLIAVTAAVLATSIACALAQARLVSVFAGAPERILVRWTFMGALGDIAAPLLFAALERWHGGFRSAFVCCGMLCVCHAALLYLASHSARTAAPDESAEEQPPPLRAALTQRTLLFWACATVLCDLLDEIFLVFGSLHLQEQRAFDRPTIDLILAALAAGSVFGIAAADRWLTRLPPRGLLASTSVACIATFVIWLQLESPLATGVAAFILGASIGPQYPLAQAQCYRCVRSRPLLVSVLESLLQPIQVALPWVVGVLADHGGIMWALAFLSLQPVCLLAATLLAPPPAADGG